MKNKDGKLKSISFGFNASDGPTIVNSKTRGLKQKQEILGSVMQDYHDTFKDAANKGFNRGLLIGLLTVLLINALIYSYMVFIAGYEFVKVG